MSTEDAAPNIRPMMRWAYTVSAMTLIAAPGQLPAQQAGLNPTPAETRAFLTADANQDALLQFAEFKVFIRLMADAGQPTARKVRFFSAYRFAFSVADGNRDRVVSPDELRAADNDYRSGKGPDLGPAHN